MICHCSRKETDGGCNDGTQDNEAGTVHHNQSRRIRARRPSAENDRPAPRLSEFRENLTESYSHIGRPSVEPERIARMLIIGYSYGIRSERRLCEEVSMNLAYCWFCRLSLRDKVPDRSSFSKNRHGRFRDHYAFRQLFDSVL